MSRKCRECPTDKNAFSKQESIPVGCVPLAFLVPGSLPNSLDADPPPPGCTPPRYRPPGWKPLCRQKPPVGRPPGHVTCDACWEANLIPPILVM